MSYTKQNFQNGDTLSATPLNAMDNQIASNDTRITTLENTPIPEATVKTAVDTYVAEHSAGFATEAEIEELSEDIADIYHVITTQARPGSTVWIHVPLKQGVKYKVHNGVSGVISISTWGESKSGAIETYGTMQSGEDKFITPNTDAYYLAAYTISGNGDIVVYDYSSQLLKLSDKIDCLPSTILMLGDSILGYDRSVTTYLTELTGSTVYNCAFGGTSVSNRTDTTSAFYPFDGVNIVTAMKNNDFTEQEAKATETGQLIYPEKLNMLEGIDMSDIELVILNYGTNDYTQGKTIEQITTAIGQCVDMLYEMNPLVRIVVITPIWRYFSGGLDGDTRIYNISTLKQIANGINEYCENNRIYCLNAYKQFELNTKTMTTLCVNDSGSYVHLKPAGAKKYAHLINGKMRSIY